MKTTRMKLSAFCVFEIHYFHQYQRTKRLLCKNFISITFDFDMYSNKKVVVDFEKFFKCKRMQ